MSDSTMTRRQFLRRFGAVGGSSLVLGAMDAWALAGQPAGPKPEWSGRPRNVRVLVLGAGVSGMAVAYELGKLGYYTQVLEARDRVGGVNHTIRRGTRETELTGEEQVCEFDEGLYFNAGPWRIPNSHTAVLGYCKELNVPLQIFINEHDSAIMYYEGEEFGELSGRRVRLREVKADMRGYTSELLAKAIDQQLLDLPMTREDTERLIEYLVGEGYLQSPDHVYVGSAARGGGDPYAPIALLRAGFAGRVRAIDSPGNTRAPMFQPIGGMDQIPMGFQRVLADRIKLGAEVRTIRQTEDEVRVTYRDRRTGVEHELTADYVVSCLPLTILRELEVDLTPEMAAAVAEVNYSPSAKIGIQMRRRFWEEDDGIFGGASYTNLPLGQFAYPSNDFFSQKGVLLGFYGSDAVGGIRDMPIQDRIAHVVTTATRLHPQVAEEFESGYAALWSKIPYSKGAFAQNPGPALERLSEPSGRIYIGCAAVSESPGWMEGAFSAAWGTVERLHRRVMA